MNLEEMGLEYSTNYLTRMPLLKFRQTSQSCTCILTIAHRDSNRNFTINGFLFNRNCESVTCSQRLSTCTYRVQINVGQFTSSNGMVFMLMTFQLSWITSKDSFYQKRIWFSFKFKCCSLCAIMEFVLHIGIRRLVAETLVSTKQFRREQINGSQGNVCLFSIHCAITAIT